MAAPAEVLFDRPSSRRGASEQALRRQDGFGERPAHEGPRVVVEIEGEAEYGELHHAGDKIGHPADPRVVLSRAEK